MVGRKRRVHQWEHPFDAYPFEGFLFGSWQAVEHIRIESGTMVLYFKDNRRLIMEKGHSLDIRIRSRKATSADCSSFLRPGIDICVLSTSQSSDDPDEFTPEPVWGDAKINSVKRNPHDSECTCQYYVMFYVNQGSLGTQRTLSKEVQLVGINQISILQRLERPTSEDNPHRWDSSMDCSSVPQTKLFLGKFLSDISWLTVTSILKKVLFDVRSVDGNLVYQVLGGDDVAGSSLNNDSHINVVNFKTDNNGIEEPVITQVDASTTKKICYTNDSPEDEALKPYNVESLRRSKRQHIQPKRYLGYDVPKLDVGPIGVRPYKYRTWKDDDEDVQPVPLAREPVVLQEKYPKEDVVVDTTSQKFDKWNAGKEIIVYQRRKKLTKENPGGDSIPIEHLTPLTVILPPDKGFPNRLEHYFLKDKATTSKAQEIDDAEEVNDSSSRSYFSYGTCKPHRRNSVGLDDMYVELPRRGGINSKRGVQDKRYRSSSMYSRTRNPEDEEKAYKERALNSAAYKEMIDSYLRRMDKLPNEEEPTIRDLWIETIDSEDEKEPETSQGKGEEEEALSESDMLWQEMDLAMQSEYLDDETNDPDVVALAETTKEPSKICLHDNRLDEEIGIYCIRCGVVSIEIKYVKMEFVQRRKRHKPDEKEEEKEKQEKEKQEREKQCTREHPEEPSANRGDGNVQMFLTHDASTVETPILEENGNDVATIEPPILEENRNDVATVEPPIPKENNKYASIVKPPIPKESYKDASTVEPPIPEENNSDALTIEPSPPTPEVEVDNVWALIPKLREKMHDHQRKAFEFLWQNIAGSKEPALMEVESKNSGGCVISHSPGAGKTFLIIAFLVSYLNLFPRKRPLVLAPKTTLYTWYKEFIKWEIPIPVYLIHGQNSQTEFNENVVSLPGFPNPTNDIKHALDCLQKIHKWQDHPSVLVMGYTSFLSLIRSGDSKFEHRKFMAKALRESPGIMILDEGHNPRSTKSSLRKALMTVETDLRVLLSGTLFQNNFCEYFNSLCLARPKFVREVLTELDASYHKKNSVAKKEPHLLEVRARKLFVDKIAKKIDSKDREEKMEGINALKKLTNSFIDIYEGGICDDLPGLQIYTLMMNVTDVQRRFLNHLHQRMARCKAYPLELELLITLGSIHPWLVKTAKGAVKYMHPEQMVELEKYRYDLKIGSKVRFVLSLIHRVVKKEKILIFCHNIPPMKLLVEFFEMFFKWKKDREVLVLSGEMELFERGKVIDKFEDPHGASRVLIASINACAEGICLTAASRVIMMDSEWNPSKTRQAIARAFRPGQEKMVYVYQLFATGTLEEDKSKKVSWKEWVGSMIFSEEFVEDPSQWQKEKIEDDVLREMVEQDKSKLFHTISKNEKK